MFVSNKVRDSGLARRFENLDIRYLAIPIGSKQWIYTNRFDTKCPSLWGNRPTDIVVQLVSHNEELPLHIDWQTDSFRLVCPYVKSHLASRKNIFYKQATCYISYRQCALKPNPDLNQNNDFVTSWPFRSINYVFELQGVYMARRHLSKQYFEHFIVHRNWRMIAVANTAVQARNSNWPPTKYVYFGVYSYHA